MADFYWNNRISGCVPGPMAQDDASIKMRGNIMRALDLNEIDNVSGGVRAVLLGILASAIYDGIKAVANAPAGGEGPPGGGGGGGGGGR